MRILWVFSHPAPYKIDFFNELGKYVDLTVLFERDAEANRPPLFYCGKAERYKEIRIHSLKIGPTNDFSFAAARAIRKGGYDGVVINGWSTFTEMLAINRLRRKKEPYIFEINGGFPKFSEPYVLRCLKRHFIKGAAAYLAPDERSEKYLIHYGADEGKIRLYPYSTISQNEILSAPLSEEGRAQLKREAGLPAGPLYVSVGSFIPRKNLMRLLALWRRADPQKNLLLVGGGPEESEYLRFIAENKLANVFLRPFAPRPEALRYFRMADASIFITKEDIYGHVVNESLSQGTPVIANANSNSAVKLISNGVNGFLISQNADDDFLRAISFDLTEDMREAAIRTARENTIELMAATHLRILEERFGK